MKKYRLLRNNKESGPFTAAEVIQMGLKPYDLIWVDGKSAAWRYPGEMEEFKAYAPMVEEQPFDRFFKKEPVVAGAYTGDNTIAATLPKQPLVAKEKPRIRIKAEWNKIGAGAAAQVVNDRPTAAEKPVEKPVVYERPVVKQPVMEEKPVTPVVNNSTKPSWESSWLDWQQEKTAVTRASKTADAREAAAIVASKAAVGNDEPVLETKFSQSLNDIKEKYTATVLKAKTKAVEWHKFKSIAILVMLAIPVMGFGIWVGQKWSSGGDLEKKSAVKSIIPNAQVSNVGGTEPADNNQPAAEDTKPAEPKKNNGKEMIPSFDNDNSSKAAARQNANKQQLGKTHYVPIVPNPAAGQKGNTQSQQYVKKPQPQQQAATQQQRYTFTNPGNVDPSARSKTINPTLLNQNTNPAANRQPANNQQGVAKKRDDDDDSPIFSHTSKKQKIEDFVDVNAETSVSQSVQNLRLNVQNVSDFRLDLVVIDVEYFDANNRFKTGQTVYIKNIPASETMNVKVPDNPYATRIKYRVSLVSAEQKGLYLIGE